MLKNILLGVGVMAALLAILIFSGRLPIGSKKANAVTGEVVMWGTLPQSEMETFLQAVNNEAKTYRTSYVEIPESEFSDRLLNSLASGVGPDLILAPYQIILEQRARIYPFPLQSFPQDQFRNSYVDGTSILFTPNGALALPVSIEPLMLFYNRTILSKHGVISPPETWDELTALVPKLTTLDSNNKILESGVALGSASNISNSKDLLMTLVYQLGQTPVEIDSGANGDKFTVLADTPVNDQSEIRPLTTAVRFFTQFSDQNKNTYSWNSLLPQAQDQFIAEKLAMFVGFSGLAQNISLKNPRLDFGMKILPKAKGYPTAATGMKLYAVATLRRTTNPTAAFSAQSILSGSKYGPQIAQIAGGVSPIKPLLANDQSISDDLKQSILVARGWYDANPQASNSYTNAMIADINSGRSTVSEAATLFVQRLTEAFNK